jgi:16S rRNA (uracil1498-N3)-methyltransferase
VRRFRVEELPEVGARLTLDAEASHHLLRVIRHPRGGELILFDGSGLQAHARLVDATDLAIVELLGPPRPAAPDAALHLLLGIPKGPALDRALRMATEAGATHIHPVVAARSVSRSDKRARWSRILESAAQQCGRADLPELADLLPLPAALEGVAWPEDRRVAVPGAEPMGRARGAAAVAIGPEGGFSRAELGALLGSGWQAVGLSRWILRTDTAVAAALAGITAP